MKQKIYPGKTYSSWKRFHNDQESYENDVKQDFVIGKSTVLPGGTNPIKYQTVLLNCVYGPQCHSVSTGKRDSKTLKRGCKACIRLTANKEKTKLIVKYIKDQHTNHSGLQEFRDELAKNRALKSKQIQEDASKYLEMKCPKPQIRKKIMAVYHKKIYRKDLDNLKKKKRMKNDDSLNELLKYLHDDLNADVSILHSRKELQGIFFVNNEMRKNMSASPEIVLTDGTYKLFKRKFVLQMFTVVDNYGDTQVVGVGLLANESRVTIQWLFQTFKDNHGTSITDKIHSFMTDKDLTERSVINEIFPHAATLLCQFHTKKTFKREITVRKMNISCKQVDICLNLLNKMCESTFEYYYDKHYKTFCIIAEKISSKMLEYFNVNWHPIRTQWTTWGMNQVLNLDNLTNNRMESNHSKLKKHEWMQANDTLTNGVKNLAAWMKYRADHLRAKRINDLMKVDANPLKGVIGQYKKHLTPFAFKRVKHEIQNYKTIKFTEINYTSQVCQIKNNVYVIEVSPTKCSCPKWISSLFICSHIIAARELFGLPLFSEDLCQRWSRSRACLFSPDHTMNQVKINQRIKLHKAPELSNMKTNEKMSYLDCLINEIFYTILNGSATKFKKRYMTLKSIDTGLENGAEILDEKVKKPQMKILLTELITKLKVQMIKSTPEQFEIKIYKLKELESAWRQNIEVTPESINNILNNIKNLSIDDSSTDMSLLVLPTPMKEIGRQKKSNIKCTLSTYKVKSSL